MSQETLDWLNQNTLIGFTSKRGEAWHYRASDQGDEPNHYVGAIPVEDVRRRLFHWTPVEGTFETTVTIAGLPVTLTDPDRKSIVRPDTLDILGSFKSGYKVHGYDQWLVQNVENIIDTSEGDLHIGSAGLLRKGAVAWVQFELEENREVADVAFRPFLTAATSLDGSLSTTYKTGAQVVVCDNTLSAALNGEGSAFKVKHSRNSLGRISEVRDALGIIYDLADDLAAEIEHLTDERVSESTWTRFVDELTKTPDSASLRSRNMAQSKRDILQSLWTGDPRVSPWRNTKYGVVAAVNTYEHHFATVRNAHRAERNMLNVVTGQVDKSDLDTLAVLARVSAS